MKYVKLALVTFVLSFFSLALSAAVAADSETYTCPDGSVVSLDSSCPSNVSSSTGGSTSSKNDACAGLSQLDSTQDCDSQGSGVTSATRAAVNILSIVVGIVAVIMVIVAGFKYVTSGGDSGKVNSAKSTLTYALIGLALVAIAQFLVHFVFTQATSATGNTSSMTTVSRPPEA